MKKPNIVFILTDDQGYWALGCNGNSEIRTPNIDRLAAEGINLQNFFCTSPVCSPARASLLTGRIPSQHGVHDWIRGGNGEKTGEMPIEYLEGMTGYTDLLKENGYTCGISGKWHLGAAGFPQKSFDHWYIAKQAGAGSYLDSDMFRGTEVEHTEGYLTNVITDDALSFIEESAKGDKPFYLSLMYTAPHSPLIDQHPEEYVNYYLENCQFVDAPQEPRHPWSPQSPVEIQYSASFSKKDRKCIHVRELLAGYYAAIQAVDDNVGRVMQKLEELGIRDNTLVIFSADNGFNCGHHGIWGKGNATRPLNMYDTSVKVPCIFSLPGKIPTGIISDALLSGYDFMPTLLDFVGIPNPEAEKLPGRSFLPLLTGDETKEYHESITVCDEYGPARMVRTHDWKYVHRYPYGPHELYDLKNDPKEHHNLLDENRCFGYTGEEIQKKVEELRTQLEEFYIAWVDPDKDGRKEAVCGRGQNCKVGKESAGKQTFHPWATVEYTR